MFEVESCLIRDFSRPLKSLCMLLFAVVLLTGCGLQITRPTPTSPPPTAPVSLSTMTPRATFTPAPSTPIPTDSPTPTPTPILYVLQQGDSLWSVAWQYGVSVEALQEANNITDPRTLQVGQVLIIPREEEARTAPSTPTPTPLPLDLVNLDFYETPTGGLWCLGEVWNRAGTDAELVQVVVSLYDASRRVLMERPAFTVLDIVPQNGRAPFGALFEQKPADFVAYQVRLVSGEPVTYLGSRYGDLKVIDDEGEWNGNSFVVSGQVENQGAIPARDVSVVVTVYDDEGLVAGLRQAVVEDDTLAPGALSHFQVQVVPAGDAAASYTVQVQGWRGD
jgi:LysM repeat protein